MSESFTISVGQRPFSRTHALRPLRLGAVLALLLSASGLAAMEAPGKASLEKTSFYLSSAGFRVQVANDAAGQKKLRTLPAHRFVTEGADGTLRYLMPNPSIAPASSSAASRPMTATAGW